MQRLRRFLLASSHTSRYFQRSFYSKPAILTTIDSQGQLVERKIDVWLGDSHESFVMIPKEAGHTIKTHCSWLNGGSFITSLQECALIFHHITRHFAYSSSSYPRLYIPQDLPRRSDANTSPATLYLFGETHTIALDGTPDDEFAKLSRDIYRDLRPEMESLKDK